MSMETYRSPVRIAEGNSRGRERLAAMTTQHKLMYGLNRSPTLANFQNMPMILSEYVIERVPACVRAIGDPTRPCSGP